MKALVCCMTRQRSWREVTDPIIVDPRDAIIQVDTTTICGTDLTSSRRRRQTVAAVVILGHEAVRYGRRYRHRRHRAVQRTVLAHPASRPAVSAPYCRQRRYGQCRNGGGWILGHLVDGVQAQYARIRSPTSPPTACHRRSPTRPPSCSPTSCPRRTRSASSTGRVQPSDTVVIVGAGPIGLAAIVTARLFSPSHIVVIDKATGRLDAAKQFSKCCN